MITMLIQQGDLKWLCNKPIPTGHSCKLHCLWNDPQRVLKGLNTCAYQILNTSDNHRTQIVHFNWLKLCRPDKIYNKK